MLGVVLWSDVSDRKAVIWCEDQGDLAYVSASDSTLRSDDFFDAGDLVQFDVETTQHMRLASNPRLIVQKAGSDLPQVLLNGAAKQTCANCDPKVVPISRAKVRKSCGC